MPFSRGEVVLVLFPNSDLRTAKRRPALVIQADAIQTGLPQTIVAMISGNLARAGPPFRLSIALSSPEARRTGLRADSVLMLDNLATVLESEIDRTIGIWPDMDPVNAALRKILGL